MNEGGGKLKKLSIIALVLVIAMVFTGCSINELKLYNALKKTQDITSMESDTTYWFTMRGEGFTEEEQIKFEKIMNIVNHTNIKIHQKMVQNKEKTAARGLADMNIDFGGISMDTKVWVDTDFSGDEFKLIEIIKLPSLIMNFIPAKDNISKEYIVYDFQEIINASQGKVNTSEFMKFIKEIQPRISKIMEDSKEKFNPGFEVAKYKEKRIIDGKELTIYEVKLDDAAFKKLLGYTVNHYIENQDVIELIKEYMNIVMKTVMSENQEDQLAQEQFKKQVEEIEKALPIIKEKFNSFMDTYKDIKIIGDNGIVIKYGVNSDGYIVYEAGNIDLRIDMGDIDKISGNKESVKKGALKFDLNFRTNIHNINKEIKVDLPVVDESNSLNIMDMIMQKPIDMTVPVEKSLSEEEPLDIPLQPEAPASM